MRITTLTGKYNELCYVIMDGYNEVLYQGGNQHGDSQGYVSAEKGVGLETMRQYCESTLVEMVEERKPVHRGAVRHVRSLKPTRIPW